MQVYSTATGYERGKILLAEIAKHKGKCYLQPIPTKEELSSPF